MPSTSKVMLWALGESISYSFLSWKAKIAWPCVLSGHDEQGRFIATPKLFKGTLCPLVDEITEGDVTDILSELEAQRMIVTYEWDGLVLGQVVNHWKYNKPAYAARSKYPPPGGWIDRIHEKDGSEHILENWDELGGFQQDIPISSPSDEQETPANTEENSNSIEEYREDTSMSSSSDGHEMQKTYRKQADTPHHRLVAWYIDQIAPGYAKRYKGKFVADCKAIKAMLARGHSEEVIKRCYLATKRDRFWAPKHLPMRHIDENIDDWAKSGGQSGSHQPGRKSGYARPDGYYEQALQERRSGGG